MHDAGTKDTVTDVTLSLAVDALLFCMNDPGQSIPVLSSHLPLLAENAPSFCRFRQ